MTTKTIHHNGYGVNKGRTRTELYDTEYGKCTPATGNAKVTSPYYLGYKVGDSFIMGQAAYVEAMKPKHGIATDKTIIQLLPILEDLPPQKILGPDVWHPYPVEIPPILTGDYYEGHDDGRHGSIRQYNLYFESIEDLDNWDNLGIVEWRVRSAYNVLTPNPLYQPAVDRNNVKKEEYLDILQQYFVLTGRYKFPAYSLGEWEWLEDWVKIGGMNTEPKIPLDVNHPLISTTPGWVFVTRMIPGGSSLFDSQWNAKVTNTILSVPPGYQEDKRLKMILGL